MCADVWWHEAGGMLELSDADAAAWSEVRPNHRRLCNNLQRGMFQPESVPRQTLLDWRLQAIEEAKAEAAEKASS